MKTLISMLARSSALFWATSLCVANVTRGDTLRASNEEHEMLTCPLDPYFATHPDRKPKPDVYVTEDLQQYEAKWELSGDSLLLTDITVLRFKEGSDSAVDAVDSVFLNTSWLYFPTGGSDKLTGPESVLGEVFPCSSRVLANWFSGYLVVPSGDTAAPCEIYPWYTVSEHYSVIVVIDGVKRDEMSLTAGDFCRFWESQFHLYQSTPIYRSIISELNAMDDSERANGDPYAGRLNHDFLLLYMDFASYLSIIFDETVYRK